MQPPQRYPEAFDGNMQILVSPQGEFSPSTGLVDLFVRGREAYQWKDAPSPSQQRVIDVEQQVSNLVENLTPERAREIVSVVLRWEERDGHSHRIIDDAVPDTSVEMERCIRSLACSTTGSLDRLSQLPGLTLLQASSIYRFCCPGDGASIDGHSSYFFNSVTIRSCFARSGFATEFRREWSTEKRTTSQLAIDRPNLHSRNLTEYVQVYLRLLTRLARFLNKHEVTYRCAATGQQRPWRPTDVQMAGYQWWSENGRR